MSSIFIGNSRYGHYVELAITIDGSHFVVTIRLLDDELRWRLLMTAMSAQDTSRNSTQLSFRHDDAAVENYEVLLLNGKSVIALYTFS